MEFDPLISDVHCRLHVILSTDVPTDLHNNEVPPAIYKKPIRWNAEMKDQFVQSVDSKINTQELFTKLNALDAESNTFQTDLDAFVESFNSIFLESAHESFGEKSIRHNKSSNKVFQPWFDKNCKQKREAFHRAKQYEK